MAYITRHRQDRRPAAKFDRRTLRLDPQPGTCAVDHLYFQPPRHILPLQAARHGFAKQRPVRGFHEIDDVPSDELRGFQPDQCRCRIVGQQDLLVMDQDDLGQRTREIPEQPVAALDLLVALAECIEQPVHS